MGAAVWGLRPATESDRSFLFALHRAAMREYVEAIWGWRDDEQERLFDAHIQADRCEVIQAGGEDIGVLWVEDRPDELYLKLVEILPEWQGRGIGGSIVRTLRERAEAAGKPLALSVLRSNPRAARLYEREGLQVVRETAERIHMRTRATAGGTAERDPVT